jgi:predicted 3-demethylubiquinone-9 3-methyltransferase (glyoxalase superfamily)
MGGPWSSKSPSISDKERIVQKIVPHLWFDSQAEEAAELYIALFKNSRILKTTRYGQAGFEIHHQPEGKLMTVDFELAGQQFIGLNAGPVFQFTPAVSFLIACKTKEEVDVLWERFSAGGTVLMELGAYPFSERYGWTKDRYGLSWQVMAVGGRKITQKITPTLLFVGAVAGRAEEAIHYYTSTFRNSKVGGIQRYGKGEEPDKEGTVRHASFQLEGQEFGAMDSAHPHNFAFNEAISLLVRCKNQSEIDYYWEKLIAGGDPQAQICGWLKDKFGVSWQVSPIILEEMLQDRDKAKVERVTEAFLKMKKLDIGELKRAFEGR